MEPDRQGAETTALMLDALLKRWKRAPAASPAPAPTRRDLSEWIVSRRQSALYGDVAPSLARLREECPERVTATIAAAERVLRHEFDLLGSGPFVPRDPDRAPRPDYSPIDWYLDPIQRLRFPRDIHYKAWKLYDMKLPWELARSQHWVTLGQAFSLTGDERFATEIASELDDFVEANPTGIGIHWTCTMDVGLRAVSWALGLDLVKHSVRLDAAFLQRAYEALFEHGAFIRANLENTYEVTSNHFLSNVVGLWFVGAVFADLPEGADWQAFAKESIEREIDVQVLPDGADFESSVPYHRLVAELFLGSARLGDAIGQPFTARYQSRVRDMVAYLAGVLRPDGLMPQVGDADDGRLHMFSGYGSTSPQDPRHLFGPAAVMFDEPRWLDLAGEVGVWEASWWGLDAGDVRASSSGLHESRLYPDAGLAVMRGANTHYLVVTNGTVGTKGFGNHKHNDQLSFEYHYRGMPFMVDPGSYVYTSDPSARNRFRGTGYHNTILVDGVEQNELNPEWLFRLFESARAEHVELVETDESIRYVGRHHGYERLPAPLTHERSLELNKQTGTLTIRDRLTGSGEHDLRWHFHLAPAVSVRRRDHACELSAGTERVVFRIPADLPWTSSQAEYSPSYGARTSCLALDLQARVTIRGERTWTFSIEAA
jgi:hypothetical protein